MGPEAWNVLSIAELLFSDAINIRDDISKIGCWTHHSKYFEKWACGCGHFRETICGIYKKMCHIVMYHYLDMKWQSGCEIFGHIAQPCDWQLFSEEEVWEWLVPCLWLCLDVFACICFFEARALVCMWLCLRSCRCTYAFLWVRAGGSMCLPVINLMVGNSIRPCCWIHPVKIHQQGRGHLHSGSSRKGRSLQSQTKGEEEHTALWTSFRSSHLSRRGAASRERESRANDEVNKKQWKSKQIRVN